MVFKRASLLAACKAVMPYKQRSQYKVLNMNAVRCFKRSCSAASSFTFQAVVASVSRPKTGKRHLHQSTKPAHGCMLNACGQLLLSRWSPYCLRTYCLHGFNTSRMVGQTEQELFLHELSCDGHCPAGKQTMHTYLHDILHNICSLYPQQLQARVLFTSTRFSICKLCATTPCCFGHGLRTQLQAVLPATPHRRTSWQLYRMQ